MWPASRSDTIVAWRTGINWPLPPDPSGLPAPRISAWPWHGTMANCVPNGPHWKNNASLLSVLRYSHCQPGETTSTSLYLQASPAASRDYPLYTNCYWIIPVVLLPKKRRSGRLPRSRHNNGCGTGDFHGLDLFRAIAQFCFAFAMCFSVPHLEGPHCSVLDGISTLHAGTTEKGPLLRTAKRAQCFGYSMPMADPLPRPW